MASYDIIENYNAADETINFGLRLDDGKNLYEVSTVAAIKSSNEDIDIFPHIHSLINNSQLYLSIDKIFQIFIDLQCSSLIYKMEFESIIDTFCLSSCKLYLIICCRNGQIYFFDVEKLNIILTVQLEVNEWLMEKYFINVFDEEIEEVEGVDSVDNNCITFLIINKRGKIERMSFTLNSNEAIEESPTLNTEYTSATIFELEKPINIAGKMNNRILLDGEHSYIVQSADKEFILDNLNLVKIYPYMCNRFLALTNQGILLLICLNTGLTYQIEKDVLYEDFSVVLVNDLEKHLYVICKSEEQNFIQLLNFPDFTEVFSLPASTHMHLVDINSRNDDIVYLTKVQNELRICAIAPTMPEKRLERLLRKELFAEAEAFAKAYDLDFEIIRIAKATLYADKSSCSSCDIDEFLRIMDEISDLNFKLKCCLDITCEKFDDVRRIYCYGSTLDISKHQFDKDIELYQTDLIEKMYRFDTYKTLCYQQRNEFDSNSWHEFLNGDLIRILCSKLKLQEIEDAIIIYNRLDISYITDLKQSNIKSILDIIDQFSLEAMEPFLYTFIPQTLSFLPTTLSLFTAWFVNRLHFMESSNYANFPENGIDFLNKMVKLLKIDKINCKKSFNHEITKIRHLFDALKTIETLKANYMVHVPLMECLKGPQLLIRSLLTLEIKNFDAFLLFLSTFMLENHLEPDQIYLDEIIDLVQYDEKYWIPIAVSLWNCILSLNKKIDALLIMLRKAQVPWCDTMRNLAHTSLQFSHPLVKKVQLAIQNEPIYVVLNRPAYNLRNLKIEDVQTDPDHYSISRIIRFHEPTMIEDAYMLCSTPEHRIITNTKIMNHFITRGTLEDAYIFLNRNTPEELSHYLHLITHMCIYNIENNNTVHEIIDILGAIITKGIQGISNVVDKEYYEDMLKDVQSICFINKTFMVQITYNELIDMDLKKCKLDQILTEIVEDVQDNKISYSNVVLLCEKISIAFRTTSLLLKISEKVNDCKLNNECMKYLYENPSNAEELCAFATAIVRGEFFELNAVNFEDTFANGDCSILCMPTTNGNTPDVNILKDNLILAKKLATKCLLMFDKSTDSTEIFKWANVALHFMEESQMEEVPTLSNKFTYVDINACPSVNSLDAVRDIFNNYVKHIGQLNYPNPDIKYLTYFNKNTHHDVSVDAYLKNLNDRLTYLIKKVMSEGKHKCAYLLLKTLRTGGLAGQNSDVTSTIVCKVLDLCTVQLTRKVFNCKHIDEDLAFSLLLSYEHEKAVKLIKNGLSLYITSGDKLKAIAQLGIRLCKYNQILDGNYDTCQLIVTMLKWWNQIDNCKIPYKEFLQSKKDELLEKLIRNNHMDIKLIDAFCLDFKLDATVYYIMQLKYTLLNWKPKYTVNEEGGMRVIVIENDEDQLFESCMKIVHLVKNKESLFQSVNSLWKSVNFYHYEVFICILNIVSALTKADTLSKKMLLCFLKKYTRFSKPSLNEAGEWSDNYPDSQHIDPLSEWRLPLTPTLTSKDVWNIIRPEVNLKTYQIWIESFSIFDGFLTKDDICCYASKSVVSSGILQNTGSSEWILHSKHKDLFEEIDKCLQNVVNPEFNTSAAYYIATGTPPGADQVHALRIAYKYAKLYKEANLGQEEVKAYNKIKKKYLALSTTHILHVNGLAEEKYTQLVGNPEELIEALYFDERIILKYDSVVLNCPDVNKAVAEIGNLYRKSVKDKQISFLLKWLSDDNEESFNLEETISLSPSLNTTSETDPEAYLKRAVYLCSGNDLSYWQGYLVNVGLSDDSFILKARALKCFCAISTEAQIVSCMDIEYNICQSLIDKLFILQNLKNLGIGMEVETLDKQKINCLKRLSRNMQNPLTVKVMASICTTYEIYELIYWELICKNAIQLELFDDLKTYINFLKDKYHFKKFYIAAWQSIIDQGFQKPINNKDDTFEMFINNIRYIQTCPVIYDINFENIFHITGEMGYLQLSAWILQYIPQPKRDEFLDVINQRIKCRQKFMESLKELSRLGLWGTKKVLDFFD